MASKDIYLAATYYAKPRNGVQTQVGGWAKNPNHFQYDETVSISRGLNRKSDSAKVVLNLSKKTVERNGWSNERDFNMMFKYFFKGYYQYITEVMVKLDAEYFDSMLDEMKAEWEAEQAAQESETDTGTVEMVDGVATVTGEVHIAANESMTIGDDEVVVTTKE